MEKIPVFYRPEMVADAHSFSPSPRKPGLVVEAWQKANLPIEVLSFYPCSPWDLKLAHSPRYVDDVLSLHADNGFGTRSQAVADSLVWTTGSLCRAVDEALLNGIGAVSPTSGFHHAGWDFGGGFCTFNGLMVSAMQHRDLQIGIIDCDMHYGNGTDDIIHVKGCLNVQHYTAGRRKHKPVHWLKSLPRIVQDFAGCDVVIYQAGQDPHVDDPLGGWLTTEQLYERDLIVFHTLRDLGVPVAFNLAGGYQADFSKVIEGHVNTMKAFTEIFKPENQA